jgi:hypothetical protein
MLKVPSSPPGHHVACPGLHLGAKTALAWRGIRQSFAAAASLVIRSCLGEATRVRLGTGQTKESEEHLNRSNKENEGTEFERVFDLTPRSEAVSAR